VFEPSLQKIAPAAVRRPLRLFRFMLALIALEFTVRFASIIAAAGAVCQLNASFSNHYFFSDSTQVIYIVRGLELGPQRPRRALGAIAVRVQVTVLSSMRSRGI
jgi:hypothetical protein